jgi:hypothetical protein
MRIIFFPYVFHLKLCLFSAASNPGGHLYSYSDTLPSPVHVPAFVPWSDPVFESDPDFEPDPVFLSELFSAPEPG